MSRKSKATHYKNLAQNVLSTEPDFHPFVSQNDGKAATHVVKIAAISSSDDEDEDESIEEAHISSNKSDTSSKSIGVKIYALKTFKTSFCETSSRLSNSIMYNAMIVVQNNYLKF